MLGETDKKLESLGFPLDRVPGVGAIYKAVVIDGATVYSAGAVPLDVDRHVSPGKVPSQISIEEAQQAARLCGANILRNVRKQIGSLDRIERVLKVIGYVNCEPDFTQQHIVINGASELLREVFGENGVGVRAAVGMAGLPLGACVEVEAILKLKSI